MKELVLAHSVRVGSSLLASFREPGNSWERQANGDYILRPEGCQDEYLLPATSVKYERRSRSSKSK